MKSTLHWALASTILVAACSNQPFTVDVPFRVTSVTPSPGGQNIARRAEIVVTFSEDIDPGSVTSNASFKVELVNDDGATPVAGSYAYGQKGAAPYAASFKPNQPMPWGATVRLTLTTDVKRARDGAPLPTPISFEFQLETAPALSVASVSAVPADSPDAKLVVTFSEPVKCASLRAIVVTETFDTALRSVRGSSRRVTGDWECEAQASSDAFNCEEGACTYRFIPTPVAGNTRAFDWSSRVAVAFNDADATQKVESIRGATLASLPNGGVYTLLMPHPAAFNLVSSSPAPGAVGVAQTTALEFEFNAPPLCKNNTLVGATVSATGTGPVSGEWTCPSAATASGTWLVTFQPAQPLARNSKVTTKLAGGQWSEGAEIVASTAATSVSGSLKTNVLMEFSVVAAGGIAVVSTSPVKGEVAVGLGAPIEVNFSDDVDCDSLILCNGANSTTCSINLVQIPDAGAVGVPVAATVSCPSARTVRLEVEPTAQSLSSTVSVKLLQKVKSTEQGALSDEYAFEYHLVNPPPFSLLHAGPADGAKGVEQKPTLAFTFSHAPECTPAGLTGAQVTVGPNDDPVAGSWDCTQLCTNNGCTVTFTPAGSFPLGSKVTTVFQAGVVKTAGATSKGGALPAGVSVTFDVAEPQPLVLVSSTPGAGATGVSPNAKMTLQFSRDIDCGPSLVVCNDGSCPVSVTDDAPGATQWIKTDCSGATLTIKPAASPLGLSTAVTVALKADGVHAADGGRIEQATSLTWTVEHPAELLQVASSAPTGNDPATALFVEFSRDLDVADCGNALANVTKKAEIANHNTAGNLGAFTSLTGTWACDGTKKVTFKPTDATSPSGVIRLSIGSSTFANTLKAKDATTVSGYLATPTIVNFRMLDPAPLQIVSTRATTSGPTTTVEFKFDRNVGCTTSPALILSGLSGTPDCSNDTMTVESSEFVNGNRYTATALKTVRASDSTKVGTVDYGTLGKDVVFEFEITGPLEIVATSPEANAIGVRGSDSRLALTFNQAIDVTKLVPCVNVGSLPNCNVSVKKGIASTTFLTLTDRQVSADSTVVSYKLSEMEPNTKYTVFVEPRATGPVSSDGKARLKGTYSSEFTSAGRADTVYNLFEPPLEATNTPITTDICVTFTDDVKPGSLSTSQFVFNPNNVTFAPIRPFQLSGVGGKTSNKVCLNLINDGNGVGLPMAYATPYSIEIENSIEFENLAKVEENKMMTFTTEAAPNVSLTAEFDNVAVTDELSDTDVPFNAKLTVNFSAAINPNTVNTATVILTDTAADTVVGVAMHVTPTALTLTSPTDDTLLKPDTDYDLEIIGGTLGVLMANGKAMGTSKTFTFKTSTETTFIDPTPNGDLPENVAIVFSATRALHPPSITTDNAFGKCHDYVYTGTWLYVGDIEFAVTADGSDNDACEFTMKSSILDERGNPVKAASFMRNPIP